MRRPPPARGRAGRAWTAALRRARAVHLLRQLGLGPIRPGLHRLPRVRYKCINLNWPPAPGTLSKNLPRSSIRLEDSEEIQVPLGIDDGSQSSPWNVQSGKRFRSSSRTSSHSARPTGSKVLGVGVPASKSEAPTKAAGGFDHRCHYAVGREG